MLISPSLFCLLSVSAVVCATSGKITAKKLWSLFRDYDYCYAKCLHYILSSWSSCLSVGAVSWCRLDAMKWWRRWWLAHIIKYNNWDKSIHYIKVPKYIQWQAKSTFLQLPITWGWMKELYYINFNWPSCLLPHILYKTFPLAIIHTSLSFLLLHLEQIGWILWAYFQLLWSNDTHFVLTLMTTKLIIV